jgi:hypothetical protein
MGILQVKDQYLHVDSRNDYNSQVKGSKKNQCSTITSLAFFMAKKINHIF